ncbi:MAG: hypothetical protein KJ624_04305 [Chloroflexi bacterium]|nr:hypothetical protein [Chloroflexota bacterium]
MSRIEEKLKRLGRGGVGMGFRAATAPQERGMLLIARISPPGPHSLEGLVDAFLVETGAKPPSGVVWGTRAETPTPEALARLKEKGCDFVILDPEKAPASALEGEMGCFVQIDPSLPDSFLRAVEGLEVEGAFMEMEAAPLRVQHLLVCQRVAGLVRRPLLVAVSPELSGADVVQLRRVGVRGLVVRAEVGEKLEEWHQALLGAKQKGKENVVLPRSEPPTPGEEEEE